jgi:hypothetical protein
MVLADQLPEWRPIGWSRPPIRLLEKVPPASVPLRRWPAVAAITYRCDALLASLV